MLIRQLAKKVLPDFCWSRLRLLRRRYVLSRFQVTTVSHTYGGFPLQVCMADPIGRGWYDRDWPELPEIALLRASRLRPGARVFNLGAHQCIVALMLANIVGPEGSVIAVEANSRDAAIGAQNRSLNGVGQLHILHAAAADTCGKARFNNFDACVDESRSKLCSEVRTVSVDALSEEYGFADVLFIDVEGYECRVLRGGRKTLARRPSVFVEVHVGVGLERMRGSVADVLSFFPPADYQLFVASESDTTFRALRADDEITRARFFLVAVAR